MSDHDGGAAPHSRLVMSLRTPESTGAGSFRWSSVTIPLGIAAGGLGVAIACAVQFDVGGLFREVFFSLGGCDNHAPDAPECPSPSRGLRILFMQIQVIAIVGVAVGVVAGIVGRGWSGWVGMLAGAMLVGLFADGLGLLPAISQNAWLLFLFVGFVALTPGYAGARIVARAWRRRSGGTDASRVFRGRG